MNEKLFTPIKIGALELKNRFMMAPMETGMGEKEGFVSERLKSFYAFRARNHVAMIMTGSIGISPEGRGLPHLLSIYDDKFIPGLKELTDVVHRAGGKLGAQLYHAGRQATDRITGLQPLAPSPIPCPVMQCPPREMTVGDIEQIGNKFVAGAVRLEKAGFDLIEVHLAHGYLLHSFLSPFSNKRTDHYGGSLENRLRFPRQVVKSVMAAVGVPVTIRISAEEFIDEGLHRDEVIDICSTLEKDGVQAISVSAGSYGSLARIIQPMMIPRGVLVPYAETIKKNVRIPVIVAGRLNHPALIREVVNKDRADMVALGRPLIADGELVSKIRTDRESEITRCIACNQGCIDRLLCGHRISCFVNPYSGNELDCCLDEARTKKKVMVVGGGPAGLSASKTCAMRGHEVLLVEKNEALGGKIPIASYSPGKKEFLLAGEDLINAVGRFDNIVIRKGVSVDRDYILNEAPDVLVIAVGSIPIVPKIAGVEKETVFIAEDILKDKGFVRESVVIVGGGLIGIETALELRERGVNVTVIDLLPEVVKDAGPIVKTITMEEIDQKKITVITECHLDKITPQGIMVDLLGRKVELKADAVILAMGYRSNETLVASLKGIVPEEYVIGDAMTARNGLDAIQEGFYTALGI